MPSQKHHPADEYIYCTGCNKNKHQSKFEESYLNCMLCRNKRRNAQKRRYWAAKELPTLMQLPFFDSVTI